MTYTTPVKLCFFGGKIICVDTGPKVNLYYPSLVSVCHCYFSGVAIAAFLASLCAELENRHSLTGLQSDSLCALVPHTSVPSSPRLVVDMRANTKQLRPPLMATWKAKVSIVWLVSKTLSMIKT